MTDRIPASVREAAAAVGAVLHWPGNIGVEVRQAYLPTEPETKLLVVYLQGIADDDLISRLVMEPLERAALTRPELGQLTPARLAGVLSAPRTRAVMRIDEAISGILKGETALIFDGIAEAVLVDTIRPLSRPIGGLVQENPYKDLFDSNLTNNVALIRKRLRDPALLAEPRPVTGGRAEAAALIYLKGRAPADLVEQVGHWLEHRAGEEMLHRGLAGGRAGAFGFLPRLISTPWPDTLTVMLDAGHVAVLVDQLPFAYYAPVTATAMLHSPVDMTLNRQVSIFLRLYRVLLAAIVLLMPAILVAMMNYHQEMLPTAFLLSIAGYQEDLPLPIVSAVVLLEVMQEVLREATSRLPYRVTTGAALIAGKLLIIILVFAKIVGPLPGVIAIIVQFSSLSLPTYDLLYLVRVWRFVMIFAAAIFGLGGIAAVLFLFVTYLTQAKSFGVPFLGETGIHFTAPGRTSNQKGGNLGASGRALR